jgi:ethanolamine utilization protein EutN
VIICRVIGSGVATVKDEHLRGLKLLVVQEAGTDDQPAGRPFIAVDTVGAGYGEIVLVTTGSSARETERTGGTSVDAAITGIFDSLDVDGRNTYQRAQ